MSSERFKLLFEELCHIIFWISYAFVYILLNLWAIYFHYTYKAIKSKIHHINLFDFQIAWYIPRKMVKSNWLTKRTRKKMKREKQDRIVINLVYFGRFDIKYQQINDWCVVQKKKSKTKIQNIKVTNFRSNVSLALQLSWFSREILWSFVKWQHFFLNKCAILRVALFCEDMFPYTVAYTIKKSNVDIYFEKIYIV